MTCGPAPMANGDRENISWPVLISRSNGSTSTALICFIVTDLIPIHLWRYSSAQTQEAVEVCTRNGWSKILIHQPNYSMLNRWIEDKLTTTCETNGMGMIAFCPLYQGLLTDKYLGGVPEDSRAATTTGLLNERDLSDDTLSVVRELSDIAQTRGQSLAQMAIAWILRLPQITSVLVGASRPSQISENCKAVQNLTFSEDELTRIHQLTTSMDLPSLWTRE